MKTLSEVIPESFYQNKKVFEAEVVYEMMTLNDRLSFGIAIADIEESTPHFHKKTLETYNVVQGEIEVSLGETLHQLVAGDTIKIPLGVVHSARTLGVVPARIVVVTIPIFSTDDYFPVAVGAS